MDIKQMWNNVKRVLFDYVIPRYLWVEVDTGSKLIVHALNQKQLDKKERRVVKNMALVTNNWYRKDRKNVVIVDLHELAGITTDTLFRCDRCFDENRTKIKIRSRTKAERKGRCQNCGEQWIKARKS